MFIMLLDIFYFGRYSWPYSPVHTCTLNCLYTCMFPCVRINDDDDDDDDDDEEYKQIVNGV